MAGSNGARGGCLFRCGNFSWANVARRQSLTLPTGDKDGLKRVLRWWDLLTFGVASTIGAGIFVTSGVAIQTAGAGIIFAFIVSGFAALLSGLCYAEYAARIPVSGSAYTFVYTTLGELCGWLIGWNMTLEYAVAASAVAQGWAGYFTQMMASIGVPLPTWLSGFQLWGPFSLTPLTACIIVFCTLVLLVGVKESSLMNMIVTATNIVIIGFIIVLGAMHFELANWDNFFLNTQNLEPPAAVMAAAAMVFFSFIGFDAVTTLASEVKYPKTDLPLSIVGTLVIVTTLYVAVSIVLTGMVTAKNVNIKAPLSAAFATHGIHWAAVIVAVTSVTTLTANVLASLIGQPRIFYQMSKDGLLMEFFSTVTKRGVPIYGTLVTASLAGVLALFFNLDALSNMISAGTLLAYGTVAAGIIVMRYSPASLQEGDALIRTVPRYSRIAFLEPIACVINGQVLSFLLAFCVSTVFLGVSLRMEWPTYVSGIFGGLMGVITIILYTLAETNVPDTFRTPLVPLVPLGAVAVNVLLIVRLPLDSIYRVLIWTVVGIIIYVFYGLHYSRLNEEKRKPMIIPEGAVTDYSSSVDYGAVNYRDTGNFSDSMFDRHVDLDDDDQ